MLPIQFEERMKEMMGQEYVSFLSSFSQDRYYGLRYNPLKTTKERFLEQIRFPVTPIDWCPTGYYYQEEDSPGKHVFHQAGVYYIQEPSAMAVAEVLPMEGELKVLDLCAAPGGKSSQLAGKMKGRGILVSNEIHPARAKILSENMERMGVTNCIVTNETPDRLAKVFPEFFDRILVDAPCSGEGMFRKNEEAVSQWSTENVQMCALRQQEILKEAVKMLRPGGYLCYSTCTFAPEENEQCAEWMIHTFPEISLVEIEKKEGISSGNPEWTKTKEEEVRKTARLWPNKVKGEGHFLALYKKEGSFHEEHIYRQADLMRTKEIKGLDEFLHSLLTVKLQDRWMIVKDRIYFMMDGLPALQGIRVLRAGILVGSIKKNRIEPEHSLALALSKDQVKYSYSMNEEEAAKYIAGEAIPYEGEKGWYLMMAGEYSLGWAKMAGGMLKNHYPKGLRK